MESNDCRLFLFLLLLCTCEVSFVLGRNPRNENMKRRKEGGKGEDISAVSHIANPYDSMYRFKFCYS